MERKQRFLNNFQLVRQKLKDLEEKTVSVTSSHL